MSGRGFAVSAAALAVEVVAACAACVAFWLSPFCGASLAWLGASCAAAFVVVLKA